MTSLNQPPDLVVRPAGVWDTRAPMYTFVQHNHKENQVYYALLLGIKKLLHDTDGIDPSDRASTYFQNKTHGPMSRRIWKSFTKSFPEQIRQERTPLIREVRELLHRNCIPAVTEYAISSYCGIFEVFVQCWALNFLLAKLESGKDWRSEERKLARSFWPFKQYKPGLPEIYEAIPILKEKLKQLPHVFVNPTNDNEVNIPITPNLNAFMAINFWRDWRNLLVHRSGIVNSGFASKHKLFWKDFRSIYPHINDFQEGKRLSLNDETFRAMTTTHYRAAKSLRDILVDISESKRGHVRAPEPASKTGRILLEEIPQGGPPPLLLPIDHQPSYLWASNLAYRRHMGPLLSASMATPPAISIESKATF